MSAEAAARTEPLRNRNFRALLGYRICTILSYQMVAVTVGWHVYDTPPTPRGFRYPSRRPRRADLRKHHVA